MVAVEVVPYRPEWADLFQGVAAELRRALRDVDSACVEHVGSTSVPGLAAKPILDVDVIVRRGDVAAAIAALESIGYVWRGDLGLAGREAFLPPDEHPKRHVYVCEEGGPSVRNHLAVREVLRRREDLRDAYGAVKMALAGDPAMDIDTYIAGKSAVLQEVLAASDLLTDDERRHIKLLNESLPHTGTVPPAGDLE